VRRRAVKGGKARQGALVEVPLHTNPTATCRTTVGNFRVEIFLKEMPVTASNFIDLVQRGFYNGLNFHRVVPGFVCQFGCPYSKDPHSPVAGTGGPVKGTEFKVLDGSRRRCVRHGGHIPDEFPGELSNTQGTLAMANMGMANTGGSQFFINVNDNSYLDWFDDRAEARHLVFGRVIEGFEKVLQITGADRDRRDMPIKPITMLAMRLDEDDPEGAA